MRVKRDWLQIGMTKSVRAESEMKWVVGMNVSHQQYNTLGADPHLPRVSIVITL